METCCVKGCDRPVRLRGMCAAHYDRMRTGKDMSSPVRRVVRSGSDMDRFMSKVDKVDSGCWEWNASRTPLGYGQFRFRGTRELSHRVSWMLFKGDIPPDTSRYGTMGVLHKCDNPCCVNPDHLFVGDQSANSSDSVSKERWGKRGLTGEAHGRALLSESDVRAIRASDESIRNIAKRYGISPGAVQHIRKRRSWQHID